MKKNYDVFVSSLSLIKSGLQGFCVKLDTEGRKDFLKKDLHMSRPTPNFVVLT
jgi:hypothetical protein